MRHTKTILHEIWPLVPFWFQIPGLAGRLFTKPRVVKWSEDGGSDESSSQVDLEEKWRTVDAICRVISKHIPGTTLVMSLGQACGVRVDFRTPVGKSRSFLLEPLSFYSQNDNCTSGHIEAGGHVAQLPEFGKITNHGSLEIIKTDLSGQHRTSTEWRDAVVANITHGVTMLRQFARQSKVVL